MGARGGMGGGVKRGKRGDTDLLDGVDKNRGWVVFVPSVIPGELVRGRIYRNHAGYSDADLMEVLEESPERVEPKCKVVGCGGCQYQHWNVDGQRGWKTKHVKDLFERIGGVDRGVVEGVTKGCVGTEEVYGYR